MEAPTIFFILAATAAALLLAVTFPGTLYLFVLTLAGSLPAKRSAVTTGKPMTQRIAVVMPAHNEAEVIARTLDQLLPLVVADGAVEVIVVADNCTDTTAAIARRRGARVLERRDAAKCGKRYALDYAFRELLNEDFAAFVVIDADSCAEANLFPELRLALGRGARAAQIRYLVLNGDANPRTRLAGIALSALNVLRPRGRQWLGVSAGIFGNGFVLRREVLEQAPYTATSVFEDLEYHLQLLAAGVHVDFIDTTTIRSEMPTGAEGTATQRARWEGGRLRMLCEHGPLLWRAVLRGKARLLDPLCDLLLLPLAYHVTTLLSALLLAIACGSTAAAWVALASLFIVAIHVLAAMRIAGLPWSHLVALARVPSSLLWKLLMITTIANSAPRDALRMRTSRDGS